MTLETLNEAIKRLLIKRQNIPYNDYTELDRTKQKLTKLYDLKYLTLQQQKQYNIKY